LARRVFVCVRATQVRGHESFCQYLVDKAPSTPGAAGSHRRAALPFEGKNAVVYSLPPTAKRAEEACAACLGPHGDAAAGGWVAAGLGDSARRRQPPRWRDPAGAAANPAATAAAAAAEEEDTAAAAAAAPAQSGDGAEEAAACVAYVAACTVQLAVYAAAGKWFPAVALLSAMARHPGPGRRRRPRPGRPPAGDPADGSTDGGPASGPARLGAATRRPDAACGWLAARACAASGEWRPALKVLNVLRRCVLPP